MVNKDDYNFRLVNALLYFTHDERYVKCMGDNV